MNTANSSTTKFPAIRLVVNNFSHAQASSEFAEIEILVTPEEYRLIKAMRSAEREAARCFLAAGLVFAEKYSTYPVDSTPHLHLVRPPVEKDRKKTSSRMARGRSVQQAMD